MFNHGKHDFRYFWHNHTADPISGWFGRFQHSKHCYISGIDDMKHIDIWILPALYLDEYWSFIIVSSQDINSSMNTDLCSKCDWIWLMCCQPMKQGVFSLCRFTYWFAIIASSWGCDIRSPGSHCWYKLPLNTSTASSPAAIHSNQITAISALQVVFRSEVHHPQNLNPLEKMGQYIGGGVIRTKQSIWIAIGFHILTREIVSINSNSNSNSNEFKIPLISWPHKRNPTLAQIQIQNKFKIC